MILFNLIDKYAKWAGFDRLKMFYHRNGRIYCYDNEEKIHIGLNSVLRYIFDNGMLNECFAKEELETLFDVVPDCYKMDVYYYLEEINGK